MLLLHGLNPSTKKAPVVVRSFLINKVQRQAITDYHHLEGWLHIQQHAQIGIFSLIPYQFSVLCKNVKSYISRGLRNMVEIGLSL